ncbi:MAG: HEAT repeat domain-containing protein [Candidatus Obscuribacterales bacterium]
MTRPETLPEVHTPAPGNLNARDTHDMKEVSEKHFDLFGSAYSDSSLQGRGLDKSLNQPSADDPSLAPFDMSAFKLIESQPSGTDMSGPPKPGTKSGSSGIGLEGAPPGDAGQTGDASEHGAFAGAEQNGLSDKEINDLIARLDSDNFREREKARKDLVEAPNHDRVLERLRETVENPLSLEQQTQAQRAIAEMGEDPEAKSSKSSQGEPLSDERIDELIGNLDSDSFQEREDATRALERAGNPEDVMKRLAETIEHPRSFEQRMRAQEVARGLGANATPEQLQGLYDAMQGDKLSGKQKQLYESAVNGGLESSDWPVTFKDEQGRVTGIFDGGLDNPVLTARYNEAGQVQEATIRGTTFTRNDDGTYKRSDGFSATDVSVSEQGLRFSLEGGSVEWRPDGSTATYNKDGVYTGTTLRDGTMIQPDGTIITPKGMIMRSPR